MIASNRQRRAWLLTLNDNIGAQCDPKIFRTEAIAYVFSAKGATFSASLGSAPGFVEPQNNVSAESAIHFCLGLRNHLLN